MKTLSTLTRTLALSAVLTGMVAGTAATPAGAKVIDDSCKVSVDAQPVGGYSIVVTYLSKGVTCKQAKLPMIACETKSKLVSWKLSKAPNGRIRFTNRYDKKRRFVVVVAGGTPKCIGAAGL